MEVRSKREILEEMEAKNSKAFLVEEALTLKEQKSQAEADQILREKTQRIEEIVYKKLKQQLKQKLQSMKQNPNDLFYQIKYYSSYKGDKASSN